MLKKALSVLLALTLTAVVSAIAVTATSAADENTITVIAESNFFPATKQSFTQQEIENAGNLISVTYFINSEEQLLNCDWIFSYEGDKVEVNQEDNRRIMYVADSAMINYNPANYADSIMGNCSALDGYYLNTEDGNRIGFVSIALRPKITSGEIHVNLKLTDMKFTRVEPGSISDDANETYIVYDGELQENTLVYEVSTSAYPGQYDESYVDPEPTEEPTEATTEEPATAKRKLGDINNDGYVTIQDATMVQRHASEFTNSDGSPIIDETNTVEKSVADVDFDGSISIKDVTMIQRHVAEMTNPDGSSLIDETIVF